MLLALFDTLRHLHAVILVDCESISFVHSFLAAVRKHEYALAVGAHVNDAEVGALEAVELAVRTDLADEFAILEERGQLRAEHQRDVIACDLSQSSHQRGTRVDVLLAAALVA